MKKSTVILIMLFIILSLFTVISFFELDYGKVKTIMSDREYDYSDHTESGETVVKNSEVFDDCVIKALKADICLVRSDKSGLEISGASKKYLEKNYNIFVDNGCLHLEAKGHLKRGGLKWRNHPDLKIKVYLKDGAKADIDYVDGSFNSDVNLKKLELDFVNGGASLSGTSLYDADIVGINGDIVLSFSKYDGEFEVNLLSGHINYFGDDIPKESLVGTVFSRQVGDGDKNVDIDLINGDINISSK